jgi:hypothetical protein
MADIGIHSVEMCSPNYGEFAGLTDGKHVRKILDDQGLECPSGHFGINVLRTRQPEMIAWAKDIGMTQMCTASLGGQMQNGITTMDSVKKAADEYNNIGAQAAKAGLQQVLHDEGFEMSKVEGDGRVTYEVLLELLDPKLVKMQFQISALRVVGDPVMYFNKSRPFHLYAPARGRLKRADACFRCGPRARGGEPGAGRRTRQSGLAEDFRGR